MQIPSFRTLLYGLVAKGTVDALNAPGGSVDDETGETRISVPIRSRTRAFFDAQARQLNSSVAALTGATLDYVAAQELDATGPAHHAITDRFYLLLKEHRMSLPAAAEVLRDLHITAGDMSQPAVLINRLTTENIGWIADHFDVNYDWLAGKSSTINSLAKHYWYKSQLAAAERLLQLARSSLHVDFLIVRIGGFDYESDDAKDDEAPRVARQTPEFRPVVCVQRKAGPRETYTTYEVWEDGRWSYGRCREHIKLVVFAATLMRERLGLPISIRGASVDAATFHSNVLMASLLSSNPAFDWHPDDFVEPTSHVAKDMEEWTNLIQFHEYAAVLRGFDALISRSA